MCTVLLLWNEATSASRSTLFTSYPTTGIGKLRGTVEKIGVDSRLNGAAHGSQGWLGPWVDRGEANDVGKADLGRRLAAGYFGAFHRVTVSKTMEISMRRGRVESHATHLMTSPWRLTDPS